MPNNFNKIFIGTRPGGSACRQAIDKQWLKFMDLVFHLKQSSWIMELEYALERFSIRTYLDWFDQHHIIDGVLMDEFPERFLNCI